MKKIKIGIIGLGYVGLPLAVEFSKKYDVIGFDKKESRIKELKNNFDSTLEVSREQLISSNNLNLTLSSKNLKNCNVFIVTVPTPINNDKTPNLYPLKSATELVASLLKKNDIVIYESTVYPGATEEFCVPILEKLSDLQYNKDFFCGYSPERINPGDKEHTLKKIIKITSGSNPDIADFIDKLYKSIISAGTFKARSIMVAEAAKVIENTQRDVNIALMNELAIIFNELNIDTMDVLKAAKTKWNFLPFNPGLVGGHCIGIDPYYLTYKSMKMGYNPKVILSGRSVNDNMASYIIKVVKNQLKKENVELKDARIGILGLTFKENCPDIRNSKVFDILEKLRLLKCKVEITDPLADPSKLKEKYNFDLIRLDKIEKVDIIILAVAHDIYKDLRLEQWKSFFNNRGFLLDIKSVYDKNMFKKTNIDHWRL